MTPLQNDILFILCGREKKKEIEIKAITYIPLSKLLHITYDDGNSIINIEVAENDPPIVRDMILNNFAKSLQ
jgi:hypothetical protein